MSHLLHGTQFLFERLTDKLWLSTLKSLADIFLKVKEVDLSLQEKQVTVLSLPVMKFKLSGENLRPSL